MSRTRVPSKSPSLYTLISLKIFLTYETLELHGLGPAVASTVEVARKLVAEGHATITGQKQIHNLMRLAVSNIP